jgi:hypothetical protein
MDSKVSRYHEETLNSPYHMPFHSLTLEQCHFLCFCTLHGESHGQQPHFLKIKLSFMEEYRFEAVNLSTTLINLLFRALAKKNQLTLSTTLINLLFGALAKKILKLQLIKLFGLNFLRVGLRIFGCQSGHSIVESLQVKFSSFKQFNKVHQISSPFLFSFHLCPREGGCRVVLCTS